MKQSNGHLENVEGDDLLRKVVELLHGDALAQADCSFEEPAGGEGGAARGAGILQVTSRAHGYPLMLRVRVTLGSALQFFEAVTRPLLQTVADLSKSERELSTLLCDKDREIGEYKEEGGKLLLKYLKTAPFDAARHRAAHAAHRDAFGDDEAAAALLDVANRAAAAAFPKIAKQEVKAEDVKVELNSQAENGSGRGLAAGSGGGAASAEGAGAVVKSDIKREPPATTQRSPHKKMKKKFLNM